MAVLVYAVIPAAIRRLNYHIRGGASMCKCLRIASLEIDIYCSGRNDSTAASDVACSSTPTPALQPQLSVCVCHSYWPHAHTPKPNQLVKTISILGSC